MRESVRLLLIAIACFVLVACAATSYAQPKSGAGIGTGGRTDRPRIKSKPEAEWPEGVQIDVLLTIVLRVKFGSNGEVSDLKFLEVRPEKPEGLRSQDLAEFTTKAKEAARKIEFTPGVKDGRPISVYLRVEYNFQRDETKKPKTKML
jgi:hypothetical protein